MCPFQLPGPGLSLREPGAQKLHPSPPASGQWRIAPASRPSRLCPPGACAIQGTAGPCSGWRFVLLRTAGWAVRREGTWETPPGAGRSEATRGPRGGVWVSPRALVVCRDTVKVRPAPTRHRPLPRSWWAGAHGVEHWAPRAGFTQPGSVEDRCRGQSQSPAGAVRRDVMPRKQSGHGAVLSGKDLAGW